MNKTNNIEIRECTTIDELAECVQLQREVFALPEIEVSPVRHLVVTKNAGGWTLGAFENGRLVGFVLSVPAFLRDEKAFYSHMTAVHGDFQSYGIGARLKWAQRERALAEGVKYIKWTFEPVKARNAHFNLEKLGAIISDYQPNFYGTDYSTPGELGDVGLSSDRLFAEWHIEDDKVKVLAAGEVWIEKREPVRTIIIPNDWYGLVKFDIHAAKREQERVRAEFESALADGLECSGFRRDVAKPAYLFYKD